MEDVIMTFAFLLIAVLGIIIRLVIPTALIIIGIFGIKNNKNYGKVLLIIGLIYLFISIAYFVYSGIKYGF